MKMPSNRKKTIILGIAILIIIATSLPSVYALFVGSHTLYKDKLFNATEFCGKCHISNVRNVTAGVHRPAGCICHGYNPNATARYNVNVTHNLTKDIHCTNCHSDYNITTGNITIHTAPMISGINQSAHYLNITKIGAYTRARAFFNHS